MIRNLVSNEVSFKWNWSCLMNYTRNIFSLLRQRQPGQNVCIQLRDFLHNKPTDRVLSKSHFSLTAPTVKFDFLWINSIMTISRPIVGIFWVFSMDQPPMNVIVFNASPCVSYITTTTHWVSIKVDLHLNYSSIPRHYNRSSAEFYNRYVFHHLWASLKLLTASKWT